MKKTIALSALFLSLFLATTCLAQPYGYGKYGLTTYGSQTSITISSSASISIPITPISGGALGTNTNQLTITSTDVKGFKLYIRALTNTYLNNFGTTIPASANVTAAALVVNTWGYNTDASSNFIGITASDVLIKDFVGPTTIAGNITNVKYGANVDMLKTAGNYSTSVIYTAVPQTN